MKVSDIMTSEPTCCTPDTTLRDVAKMMVECDCGSVPVCDAHDHGHIVGVITDRDIVCRAVAQGLDINRTAVSTCMTTPAVTLHREAPLEDAADLLEQNMIRRIPITDNDGCVCGILAQADIASKGEGTMITEVLREVSRPTQDSSRVGSASMR